MKRTYFDRTLLYTLTLIVVGLSILVVKERFLRQDIVYVDIGKLVNGYTFKKELEAGNASDLYRIKYISDSLQMVQKISGANPVLSEQIRKVEDAFQQYYQQSNLEMTQKVWDRLNPLIEQYGKERKLELVIGANGAGTLLYGAKGRDITDDLLSYINHRHEKGS